MCEYKNYTVEVTFLSSIGTPLQADTIFGHICWAYRYIDGEEKLKEFLGLYDKEPFNPPLLLSNGFPKGFMPKPIIPPVTQNDIKEEVHITESNRIKASFEIKTIKKTDIIPKESLRNLQNDKITPAKLFTAMYASYKDIENCTGKQQSVMVQHNTIDRVQGSVRKGGLYSQEETFFDEGDAVFEIYLRTNYFSLDDLKRIFGFISRQGFGRDKSTGNGYFLFAIAENIDLPEATNPNAFMTLSSYIPTAGDPTQGYYNIIHKYGKLGGSYAAGDPGAKGNPFKVPLIMFSAGSVFLDKNYGSDNVYGSLLKNIHLNEDIRHYAYAFPIGIQIEDTYEDV